MPDSEQSPDPSQSPIDETSLSLEVAKGFSAKVIQAVLGFLGTILFARILGPSSFGGYYLLYTVVQLSLRPVTGVAQATMKRFSEFDTDPSEIVGSQLIFNFALLTILIPIAFLVNEPLSSYTGLDNSAALFAVLFIAVVFFSSLQKLLPAKGKIGVSVWNDTLRSVFTISLQLGFVLLGYGAAGMVFGLSAATYLVLPVTHYYLRTIPTRPSRETLLSIWRFARFSIVNRIVNSAYDRLDILLIGFIITPAAAAYYEVALKFTIPATFVPGVAGMGLLNKVSSSASKGESAAMDITNTVSYASIIAVPLFFGGLALARPLIITAYGAEYANAAGLLGGLLIFSLIRSQSATLESVINGLDLPNRIVRVSTVILGLNIVIGIVLLLRFGPIGAVIATVIAESLRYLLFSRIVRKETEATLLPKPLLQQFGSGMIMFFVIRFLFESYLPIRSWFDLGFLVAVGGILYFGVLTLISQSFRVTVRAVIDGLTT